jgi:hypothetical protein
MPDSDISRQEAAPCPINATCIRRRAIGTVRTRAGPAPAGQGPWSGSGARRAGHPNGDRRHPGNLAHCRHRKEEQEPALARSLHRSCLTPPVAPDISRTSPVSVARRCQGESVRTGQSRPRRTKMAQPGATTFGEHAVEHQQDGRWSRPPQQWAFGAARSGVEDHCRNAVRVAGDADPGGAASTHDLARPEATGPAGLARRTEPTRSSDPTGPARSTRATDTTRRTRSRRPQTVGVERGQRLLDERGLEGERVER